MKTPFNYTAFTYHEGYHVGLMSSLANGNGGWTQEDLAFALPEMKDVLETLKALSPLAIMASTTIEGFDLEPYRVAPQLMGVNKTHSKEMASTYAFCYACVAFDAGCNSEYVLKLVGVGTGDDWDGSKEWLMAYSHSINIEYFQLLSECSRYLPNDTFIDTVKVAVNKRIEEGRLHTANILLSVVLDFYVAELEKAHLAKRAINEAGYYDIVPWECN